MASFLKGVASTAFNLRQLAVPQIEAVVMLRRNHHVTHATFLGQAGNEIGVELLGLELRRQLDVFSIGNPGAVLICSS